MSLPDDFQLNAGVFALFRARKLEKQLKPMCGSPIEIHFACALVVTIEGMGGVVSIVQSDDEMDAASGFFLYPQKQIGRHRVDFLLGRAGVAPVIVECDGRDFHHSTREQIERDRQRDAELAAEGYRVLRYPGTQIHNQEWHVVTDVLSELDPEFQESFIKTIVEFLRCR